MMDCRLVYATPDMLKLIEKCGRICYRSGDKIHDNSCQKFVAGIVKSGHESVIEHSNLIYMIDDKKNAKYLLEIAMYNNLINIIECDGHYMMSGNVRMFKDLFRVYYNRRIEDVNPIIEDVRRTFYELPKELFADMIINGMLREDKFERTFYGSFFAEYFTKIGDFNIRLMNLDLPLLYSSQNPHNILEMYDLRNQEQMESLMTATIYVETERIISQQLTRHRLGAVSQESQRYVDLQDSFEYYTPDLLKEELGSVPTTYKTELPLGFTYNTEAGIELRTVIAEMDILIQRLENKYPEFKDKMWFNDIKDVHDKLLSINTDMYGQLNAEITFAELMQLDNAFYKALRQNNIPAEVARAILPNCTKTRIVFTKTLKEWRHFLEIRGEKHAQLPTRQLACGILNVLHSYNAFREFDYDKTNYTIFNKNEVRKDSE